MTDIGFSALETQNGSLDINSNDALENVAFPSLTSKSGNIIIHNHLILSSVDFPLLNDFTGGMIKVYDNSTLSSFNVPSLSTINSYNFNSYNYEVSYPFGWGYCYRVIYFYNNPMLSVDEGSFNSLLDQTYSGYTLDYFGLDNDSNGTLDYYGESYEYCAEYSFNL